ncbi:hypothetical protein ACJMK2_001337, partial [Sinanodonta woodiana]
KNRMPSREMYQRNTTMVSDVSHLKKTHKITISTQMLCFQHCREENLTIVSHTSRM